MQVRASTNLEMVPESIGTLNSEHKTEVKTFL